MNASVLDLRTKMKDVLTALNRNEKVTLTYRGKKKAVIVPENDVSSVISASSLCAFGMWHDRDDMDNVETYVRNLRKGRY